ncbi:hypothetical protein CEJ86_24220 [Sinorhizobium meliloti]|uniref:Peptidoglycan-associated lipoprotein n=1 Tax=Rhizobium meliloti TaxID=382 RepID=A0A2J0YXB6_RHIML|nr:hypothetical protein CEJ86_24220 [Sinorhizobium meliloti]
MARRSTILAAAIALLTLAGCMTNQSSRNTMNPAGSSSGGSSMGSSGGGSSGY